MNKKQTASLSSIIIVVIAIIAMIIGKAVPGNKTVGTVTVNSTAAETVPATSYTLDLAAIPEFSNKPYVVIDNNKPDFAPSDLVNKSYEKYGKLDSLGRCTSCISCIGKDLMPTKERESISAVKPTGWQSERYSFVDGGSLYNRCHLIGFQLTGENANKQNLITGTRYLNVQGMLPFEEEVAKYVKSTNNHVLYRVTPIFKDNELVARGVQMEGLSVEDNGKSICFNVYCYNNQPRIEIDYKTGKSREIKSAVSQGKDVTGTYVINKGNHKFHKPDCDSVRQMSEKNKQTYTGSRNELISNGYKPCGSCQP